MMTTRPFFFKVPESLTKRGPADAELFLQVGLYELVAPCQNALKNRFRKDTRNLFPKNMGPEIQTLDFAGEIF
jgi:hypothetical protein